VDCGEDQDGEHAEQPSLTETGDARSSLPGILVARHASPAAAHGPPRRQWGQVGPAPNHVWAGAQPKRHLGRLRASPSASRQGRSRPSARWRWVPSSGRTRWLTATRPHRVVRRLVSYLPRFPHANDDDDDHHHHQHQACQRVVCWSRQQKWCALESPVESSLTLAKCEGVRPVDRRFR